jgi:PAS domain-containing protein
MTATPTKAQRPTIAEQVHDFDTNLESDDSHDAACRFRGADGRYRWFAVRAEPPKANDGRVRGWYGPSGHDELASG